MMNKFTNQKKGNCQILECGKNLLRTKIISRLSTASALIFMLIISTPTSTFAQTSPCDCAQPWTKAYSKDGLENVMGNTKELRQGIYIIPIEMGTAQTEIIITK